MSDDLLAQKRALRATLRDRRRSGLAQRDRPQVAARLAEHALALAREVAAEGGRVTAYESFWWEPPTEAMVTALTDAGYDVIVPVTLGNHQLDWRHVGMPDERLGGAAFAAADLVLSPGMTVDRTGMRLGQGGGYYDTALATLPASTPVVTVLFEEEYDDHVVRHDDRDRRVHGVLTASGVRWLRRPEPRRLSPAPEPGA